MLDKILSFIADMIGSRLGYDTTYYSNSYGGVRLIRDRSTKTVRAYGYFRSSGDINTKTVLFTLPEGYRPNADRACPMTLTTSSNATTAYTGTIRANGTITQNLGATIRSGLFTDEWYVGGVIKRLFFNVLRVLSPERGWATC